MLEVKLKFTDHTGMFMLHCHMVEHEDDGMMTQFEVVRANPTPRPGLLRGLADALGTAYGHIAIKRNAADCWLTCFWYCICGPLGGDKVDCSAS